MSLPRDYNAADPLGEEEGKGGDIERGREKEEGGGEGERWRGGEKGRQGKRRGDTCLRIRNSSLPGFMPQTLWDIKI